MPAFSTPPPAPSRLRPDTFAEEADAYLTWLTQFRDEIVSMLASLAMNVVPSGTATAIGIALLSAANTLAARVTLAVEEALRTATTHAATIAPGVQFPSGYKRMAWEFLDVVPTTDAVNALLQFTWDGTNYSAPVAYARTKMTVGGGSPTGDGSNGATTLPAFDTLSNTAGYPNKGKVKLTTGASGNTEFEAELVYRQSGGNIVHQKMGGFITGGLGMPTGARLLFSAGTVTMRSSVEPKRGF